MLFIPPVCFCIPLICAAILTYFQRDLDPKGGAEQILRLQQDHGGRR